MAAKLIWYLILQTKTNQPCRRVNMLLLRSSNSETETLGTEQDITVLLPFLSSLIPEEIVRAMRWWYVHHPPSSVSGVCQCLGLCEVFLCVLIMLRVLGGFNLVEPIPLQIRPQQMSSNQMAGFGYVAVVILLRKPSGLAGDLRSWSLAHLNLWRQNV